MDMTVQFVRSQQTRQPRQLRYLAGILKGDLRDLPTPTSCEDENKATSLIDDKGLKIAIFCSQSLEKVIKTKVTWGESGNSFFVDTLYFKYDKFWYSNRNGEKKLLDISDYETVLLEESLDVEMEWDAYPVVMYRNIAAKLEKRLKTIGDLFYLRCVTFKFLDNKPYPTQSFDVKVEGLPVLVRARFLDYSGDIFLGNLTVSKFLEKPFDMPVYYSLKRRVYMSKNLEILSNWAVRLVKVVGKDRGSASLSEENWLIPLTSLKQMLRVMSRMLMDVVLVQTHFGSGSDRARGVLNIKERTWLKFTATRRVCNGRNNLIKVEGLFCLPHRMNETYAEKVYYDGAYVYVNPQCESRFLADDLFLKAFDNKTEDAEVIAQYVDFAKFREHLRTQKPICDKRSNCVVQTFSIKADHVGYHNVHVRYHCKDRAFYVYQDIDVLRQDVGRVIVHTSLPVIVYFADSDEFAAQGGFDNTIAVFFGYR